MGGRSRQPRDNKAAVYSFVYELSDERLESYGKMTSAKTQNLEDGGRTQTGIPQNPSVFNEYLANEYKQRTGHAPNWDLRENGGHDNAHDKLVSLAAADRLKPGFKPGW